jgi:hypothetical protein
MTDAEIQEMERVLFRVAPLPLYDTAASYPNGFDLQVYSTFGTTGRVRITADQFRKIEQVLLGVI